MLTQTPNYVGGGATGATRGVLGAFLGGATPIYSGDGQPPTSGLIGLGLFAGTPVYRSAPAAVLEPAKPEPVVVAAPDPSGSCDCQAAETRPVTIVICHASETETQS